MLRCEGHVAPRVSILSPQLGQLGPTAAPLISGERGFRWPPCCGTCPHCPRVTRALWGDSASPAALHFEGPLGQGGHCLPWGALSDLDLPSEALGEWLSHLHLLPVGRPAARGDSEE